MGSEQRRAAVSHWLIEHLDDMKRRARSAPGLLFPQLSRREGEESDCASASGVGRSISLERSKIAASAV